MTENIKQTWLQLGVPAWESPWSGMHQLCPGTPCSYSAPKAPEKPPFTFVLGAMPSKPIDLSFGRGFKALVFKNQPTNEYVIIPRHSPSWEGLYKVNTWWKGKGNGGSRKFWQNWIMPKFSMGFWTGSWNRKIGKNGEIQIKPEVQLMVMYQSKSLFCKYTRAL